MFSPSSALAGDSLRINVGRKPIGRLVEFGAWSSSNGSLRVTIQTGVLIETLRALDMTVLWAFGGEGHGLGRIRAQSLAVDDLPGLMACRTEFGWPGSSRG